MHGILNIDKPTAMTSRDVVDRVVSLAGRAKAGHAGTLDPLASGVLVICLGSATRLIEWIQRQEKSYRAVVRLGARSDTLDADGTVVESEDFSVPDESLVRSALAAQVGEFLQMPPDFSARKVRGERAYHLARKGLPVRLEPHLVHVHRVELVSYRWPRVEFAVDCGGGTYIRSIARDVGEALGCGGLVEVLARTRIGGFTLDSSIKFEDLTAASLPGLLRPPLDAVADLPRVVLDATQTAMTAQGRALSLSRVRMLEEPAAEMALLGDGGRLVAIARLDAEEGLVRPIKVFV